MERIRQHVKHCKSKEDFIRWYRRNRAAEESYLNNYLNLRDINDAILEAGEEFFGVTDEDLKDVS